MAHADRLVEVRALRAGSGYLITDRLVLTAWHVVRPGAGEEVPSQVRVRVEGRIGPGNRPSSIEEPASLLWPLSEPGEDLDFALLLLGEPHDLGPICWAPLGDAGRLDVHALGYPDASIDRSVNTRDTKEVNGWTHLGDRLRERREDRGTFAIRLRDEDQPEGTPASAWPAMSGAAVFAGEALIGVIRLVLKQGPRGVLEALPVERLFGRADVQDAVRRAGCALPPRVAAMSSTAGADQSLTYRWPQAWDFEAYMEEKRGESFAGREWLFSEIDQWASSGEARALLVRADFGVGKTALLSEYIRRHRGHAVIAWYFCQHDTQATLRPETFVRSIATQLAQALPAYRWAIEASLDLQKRLDEAASDPASALEACVLGPLSKSPEPGGPRLLLIDALDEGLELDPGEGSRRVNIVDLLARKAARFPSWLRVLVTSRPNPQVITPLRAAFSLSQIDAESTGNREDLRRFILAQVSGAAVRERLREAAFTPEGCADLLLERSGGKFLFVVHALRDLGGGRLSLRELAQLPPGMDAFYLDFFERRFGPAAERYGEARKLLGVMCAAREPLSRAELAEVLGDNEQAVRAVHSRLPDFLRLRAERLNFDHASLRQWLTQEDEDGIARAGCFAVDLQEARSSIRGWALARVRAGTAHTSPYLLRNLAAHFQDDAEKRREYAHLLLERFEWSQARLESSGVPGLLADTELLKGHPEQALLQALVRNSELTLRRSAKQWCAQVLARLGVGEGSSVGLQHLVSSARSWLARQAAASELLVPATRSLHLVKGQDRVLEGCQPLAVLPDGRIVSSANDDTVRVWDPKQRADPIIFKGHSREIEALAVLPDGRIVSGAWDRTVRVWDPTLRTEPIVLEGHSAPVVALAVLADGRIASGANDDTVRVWDPTRRAAPLVFEGHSDILQALAVLPDGRVASGGNDNTVRVWDPAQRAAPLVLEGHSAPVAALAVLPDGRIVSSSWDRTVRVWDLMQRAAPIVLEGHTESVGPLALLADGRIVSGADDCTVRVWDLKRPGEPTVLEGHSGWVWALAVLPDGRIASASLDRTVRVWDPTLTSETIVLQGHSEEVKALVVLPDGRIVSGADDSTVRVWDTTHRSETLGFEAHPGPIETLVALPDGRMARSAANNTVQVWDPQRPAMTIALQGHAGEVRALAALPDGRIVSAARDRTVRVWDPRHEAEPLVFKGHTGAVEALAVLPDGRIVSAGWDRSVRVWDPELRAAPVVFKGHSNRVRVLAVLPDGRIVSGALDHTVRVWDPTQRTEPIVLEAHSSRVRALAVLPDGRIVSGSRDRTVRVWDPTLTSDTVVLEGHSDWVWALAVLPDGRIASASADSTVRVWDPTLRTEPIVLEGHSGEVRSLAQLPDGRIVSGSLDSTVRVWDAALRGTQHSFIADAPVRCLAILPTGLIVAGCADGTVHLLRAGGCPEGE